jgi:hypothetical protein
MFQHEKVGNQSDATSEKTGSADPKKRSKDPVFALGVRQKDRAQLAEWPDMEATSSTITRDYPRMFTAFTRDARILMTTLESSGESKPRRSAEYFSPTLLAKV